SQWYGSLRGLEAAPRKARDRTARPGYREPRYLEWEADENATRSLLGKGVPILRDRTGGILKPLPLSEFRRQIERQPAMFDAGDWGACSCIDAYGKRASPADLSDRPHRIRHCDGPRGASVHRIRWRDYRVGSQV
ncbi:hypothetical protein ACFWWS_37595, partial [Streptomyces sp. NPDC059083]